MKGLSAIESQAVKLFKHTRSGSYGTRDRYKHSCMNFAKFAHEHFKIQNLRNLQDKHVAAYVQNYLQEGISTTVKNDLAASRYMHDLVPNVRHQLSDNKALQTKFEMQLERTPAVKGNRAWTDQEFKGMLDIAGRTGNRDLNDVLKLCRSMGLRITGSGSQAEAAFYRRRKRRDACL